MKLDTLKVAAELLVPDERARQQIVELMDEVWAIARRETLREVNMNYVAGDGPVFAKWLTKEAEIDD